MFRHRSRGRASLFAIATALYCFGGNAHAQDIEQARTQSDAPPVTLTTKPPPGFEDLDTPVRTQFDVIFQGRQIGAFTATFEGGRFTFDNPHAVAAALGDRVDQSMARALLGPPLDANERFRCQIGQSPITGCGTLPATTSGVIVNPEAFTVSLFLGREYFLSVEAGPEYLGDPVAAPSLIQSVRLSAASSGGSGLNYGGTFDTIASVGRTSFVAQTTLSEFDGFAAREAFVQHVWGERSASIGLLQDYSSINFTSYRILGAEFGSFYGTRLDSDLDAGTPIEVLLPRRAQVEVYREGVLLYSGFRDGGLQLLDTSNFPTGSYPIQVIVRDGDQVLLDEARSFVKLSAGLPAGKTEFRFRAGERVRDSFLPDFPEQSAPFFPQSTGELVLAASARRRITQRTIAGLNVSSFDSRVFGEASLTSVVGPINAMAALGLGSDGSYSAYLSGTAQIQPVSFYLSARTIRNAEEFDLRDFNTRYQPFLRNQDTVFASAQTRLFGGALSVTGSYSRSEGFRDRYTAGLQFTRPIEFPGLGSSVMTLSAVKSDFDTRFGIAFSFFGRLDRNTSVSYNAGGQYVADAVANTRREGFSPVVQAIATRTERLGLFDLTGSLGAATDSDGERLFAEARSLSPFGSADASVQHRSGSFSNEGFSYLANLETGLAISGGAVKLGLRNPATAGAMIELARPPVLTNSASTPSAEARDSSAGPGRDPNASETKAPGSEVIAEGGYRILVDGQPYDYISPGRRVVVGLPAFDRYRISLRPEGAPQFDLDVTERAINLYPGNVARVTFEARRIRVLFGQALTSRGDPLAQARVAAGNDFVVADDQGYFTISAPEDAEMVIRYPDGSACRTDEVSSHVASETGDRDFFRIGSLACEN